MPEVESTCINELLRYKIWLCFSSWFRLARKVSANLSCQTEINYANPCKAISHLIEAMVRGVFMVTFDRVPQYRGISSWWRDLSPPSVCKTAVDLVGTPEVNQPDK